MTLRTPRRRISPRTRLRYRAIREFFRRALGSNSQQNIKINSSIAVNVTDLKRKIVGLEQQLDEVSKHCRDIVSFDQSRRESEIVSQSELREDIGADDSNTQNEPSSFERKSNGIETQIVYKSSACQPQKSDVSNFALRSQDDIDIKEREIVVNRSGGHVAKVADKKNKLHKISNTTSKLHKHKARSVHDSTAMVYSTSSFHSLANARMNSNAIYQRHSNENRKQYKEEDREEIIPHQHKSNKYNGNVKNYMGDHVKTYYDEKPRARKAKRIIRELDPDFIADIVRRQYKPVKLFNRKESDISQFSAPVCRDQEFSVPESSKAESELLCSCLHDGISTHKRLRPRRQDLNAMQSVCDTRLYNSKKRLGQKHRKMRVDAHNNSDMYDLVPVKERSSPKSRRQFVEDSCIPYEYYREVPPSPRTLRPRLNLKAQYYTELEDYMAHTKHQLKKHSPKLQKRYRNCPEEIESDIASELNSVNPERRTSQPHHPQKHLKVEVKEVQDQSRQDNITTMPYQYPQYVNEQTSISIDTSLNKTQGTELTVDKTDKALTEIKDILQSFLHEIKKETVTSQCEKSDSTCKTEDDSNVQDPNANVPATMLPNNASCNNCTGQCAVTPLIAPFTNPCCYQVLPMCSLNCPMTVPNGYVMPSQSYTCTNCVKTPKEGNSTHCCNKAADIPCHTETDELIKEIYKFVAQSPARNNENDTNDNQNEIPKEDTKTLRSRSAGDSNEFVKQDANVGTQPLTFYSKTCEAVDSRIVSDVYITESNESYSDSLLDKLSVEVTPQTFTETETTATDTDKPKANRFSKVLRSFGLFKKKKKDIIEEISESESVMNVEMTPNHPPFRQDITNYMMYEQEYYQPPPFDPLYPGSCDYLRLSDYQRHPHEYNPRWHEYQRGPHEYQPDYHPPYNPGVHEDESPQLTEPYAHKYHPQMHEHPNRWPHGSKQRPTAPPFSSSYDTSYGQMQPALCLKEVEVKSTGTQSERKMSIFKKIKKKKEPTKTKDDEYKGNTPAVTFATPMQKVSIQPKPKPNKMSFNWKTLQAKAMNTMEDDMNFTLKTQQELVAGDQKLRNALLKKLFYKKNPFSPRNTIVKSLLRKDKAMIGDLSGMNVMKRPKMFF